MSPQDVDEHVYCARDLLIAAVARLTDDNARLEAEVMLAHALDKPRVWLYAHADEPLASGSTETFMRMLDARARGEPLAYLIGIREFWSLPLMVTPDVLIPRPETERLVELALERLPRDTVVNVADLGTGSGAIAIALAKERPYARVLAMDKSESALAIARNNAKQHQVTNIRFAQSDWCASLGGLSFDLIVSNPPYLAETDPRLVESDLRFEPRGALISGADGLDAIRTIVRDAHPFLKPNGWLLLEHGWQQGSAVRALLESTKFIHISTWQDMEERERVSGGQRK